MTHLTTQAIWTALSADLRRFIRRRVADDHAAEDLLQETFVRIHRHAAALQHSDRLAAWVYRIARNVLHDHFRRQARGPQQNADLNAACVAEMAAVPENRGTRVRSNAHVWLEELIQQLPERYRDAVRLSEIEGLTQSEVAGRLDISLSAAKSRIQRGRVKLQHQLQQCCTFEFDRRGNLADCNPLPSRTVCRGCDDLDTAG